MIDFELLKAEASDHPYPLLFATVSGIDAGLWDRITGLAPGQAIVSFPHMARPLLVSIDPTPAELRLDD